MDALKVAKRDTQTPQHTAETPTPYDLVRVVTYLTDDAEEAQGH